MKVHYTSIHTLLIFSIFFTVLTGILIYIGAENKAERTEKVMQTHEVLDSTMLLFSYLQDAETGQRGYLMTGEEKYLELYQAASRSIDDEITQLMSLVSGQPEQHEIIKNQLLPAIADKREEMEQSINLYYQKGEEAARAFILGGVEIEAKDRIRSSIDAIAQLEEELLDRQIRELEESYFLYNLISFVGLLFIGGATIAALVNIRNKENENRQLISRLEESFEELSEMHKKEVALNRERGRFMGIAAHDLRSPLNAIMTITELIASEKDKLSEEHQEYLEYIGQSTDQMSRLINDLLDIHKIEEGKTGVTVEKVNVHNLLKAIIMGFEANARNKSIRLDFKSNCKNESFYTDKSFFSQVAENLISNALKFSPEGTGVHISLEKTEDEFVLAVRDEGPGIKEEEQARLFQRYQKLSNEPTGGEKSTGLGLSIAKDRMEALGGSIECISREGQSALFKTRFPDMEDQYSKVEELPELYSLKSSS